MQLYQSNNATLNTRDIHLDAMKGFAILLVVLGHAFQVHLLNFDDNILFKLIYSFHMPLFMFISGYLSFKQSNTYYSKQFLIKKFKILVIPFLTWYFIISFFISFFTDPTLNIFNYFKRIVVSPDYGLWFLWVLFLNFAILTVISNFKFKNPTIIIIISAIFIRFIPLNILGLSLVKLYLPYFLAGFLANEYKNILKKHKNIIVVFSFIIYFTLLPFWHRTNMPLFFFTNIHKSILNLLNILYRYIVAFSGIVSFFYIIKLLNKLKIYKALSWLGKYTMEIYIIHWHIYFLKLIDYHIFMTSNIWIDNFIIVLSAISVLMLSIFISYLIKKNKLFSYFLLSK